MLVFGGLSLLERKGNADVSSRFLMVRKNRIVLSRIFMFHVQGGVFLENTVLNGTWWVF